jgi:hypothetical protein
MVTSESTFTVMVQPANCLYDFFDWPPTSQEREEDKTKVG